MHAELSTDRFSFKDLCFAAEVSGLALPESVDFITLTNPATGGKATFEFNGEARCGTVDNELQGWHFRCKARGLRMTIFND